MFFSLGNKCQMYWRSNIPRTWIETNGICRWDAQQQHSRPYFGPWQNEPEHSFLGSKRPLWILKSSLGSRFSHRRVSFSPSTPVKFSKKVNVLLRNRVLIGSYLGIAFYPRKREVLYPWRLPKIGKIKRSVFIRMDFCFAIFSFILTVLKF